MDKKTQQILLFSGVGIIAYMWWKKNQEKSSFDAYNYAIGRSSMKNGDSHNCTQYGADCYWNEHYGACKCPR